MEDGSFLLPLGGLQGSTLGPRPLVLDPDSLLRPPMSRLQQESIYRAEGVLRGRGRVYGTIQEAESDLFAMFHSNWTDAQFPFVVPPVLMHNVNMRWAGCTDGKIIHLRTLEQRILLHEVAHCLCPADEGHGPVFAGRFLTLVREFMGFEEYGLLKWAIQKEKVFSYLPA